MINKTTKMKQTLRQKLMVVAVCSLAAGWFAITANAEVKQSAKTTLQAADSLAVPQLKEIKQAFYPALTKHEQEIQKALNTNTEGDFPDIPLGKVINSFQTQHGINIFLDARALEQEGLTADEPINVSLSGISLKSALNIILKPIGLNYVVNNEVLMITTADDVARTLNVRIYPVADLCDKPDDYQALENVIRNTCLDLRKRNWTAAGLIMEGPHAQPIPQRNPTISVVPQCKAIVINQTDRVHTKIVDLLSQLRQVRKDQEGLSAEKK